MYDRRTVELIKNVKNEVEKPENRMRHMQAMLRTVKVNGEKRLAIKFTCIETEKQRDKVKALADKYCESLILIGESKTTATYLV